MIAININLAAQSSQLHRGKAQATLSIAMQRLSSGLRINSAQDDPPVRLSPTAWMPTSERIGK